MYLRGPIRKNITPFIDSKGTVCTVVLYASWNGLSSVLLTQLITTVVATTTTLALL